MKKFCKILVILALVITSIGNNQNLFAAEEADLEKLGTEEGKDLKEGLADEKKESTQDSAIYDDFEDKLNTVQDIITEAMTSKKLKTLFAGTGSSISINKTHFAFSSSDINGDGLVYKIITPPNGATPGTVEISVDPIIPSGGSSNGTGIRGTLISNELTIPDTVVHEGKSYSVIGIGYTALQGLNATRINLPSTLEEIGQQGLADTTQLKECILPDSIIAIGKMAFMRTGIEGEFIIPVNVEKLGSEIFKEAPNLKQITVKATKKMGPISGTDYSPWLSRVGVNGNINEIIKIPVIAYNLAVFQANVLTAPYYSDMALARSITFYDQEGNKDTSVKCKYLFGYGAEWFDSFYEKDGMWIYNAERNAVLPPVPDNPKGYNGWSMDMVGGVEGLGTKGGPNAITDKIFSGQSSRALYPTYVFGPLPSKSQSIIVEKVYDGKDEALLYDTIGPIDKLGGTQFEMRITKQLFGESVSTAEKYEENFSNQELAKVKNVGDSGYYTVSTHFVDKKYGNKTTTFVPDPGTSTGTKEQKRYSTDLRYTVKITPATATITPKTLVKTKWKSQSALPIISLEKGSTEGTIKWDDGQSPAEGTKSYTYTYVPNNAATTSKTTPGKQIANYTNPKITGSIEIEYSTDEISEFSISPIETNLLQGESQQFQLSVNSKLTLANEAIWKVNGNSSSSTKIDESGKLTIGSDEKMNTVLSITATSTFDNTKVATSTVTVKRPISEITLDSTTITLLTGLSKSLIAKIEPDDTSEEKKLNWSSSDATIASVDQEGIVTAHKKGEATITVASKGGTTASCKVIVIPPSTVPEDVEAYPNPEAPKDEIDKILDELLETKKKYEGLEVKEKQEIEYDVVEKLHELLKEESSINVKVILESADVIANVVAKNLAEAVTKDDITKVIADTHKVEVDLFVKAIEKSEVEAENQKLFEASLKEGGWSLGNYFDMKLLKTVTNLVNSSAETSNVTELAQPIKVTIDIPRIMLGKSKYMLLCLHNGVITQKDDIDSDPNTITAYVNEFSTFDIAYSELDTIIDDGPPVAKVSKVEAGDTAQTTLYLLLALGSLLGLVTGLVVNKNQKKKIN